MIIIVINVFLSVVFDYQFTETPTFIATCIIALLGGVIILKLNNKWLNKIVV
jgi:hypothetical protein